MRTFLDTNVFAYAFLDQSAAKKSVAAGLLRKLGWSGDGFVSLQVFKEFCNVMVHRSSKTAVEIIGATQVFDGFNFVSGSRELVCKALVHRERYDIQFYDALMIAAAESAQCAEIVTEDLNDGQVYAGVKAVNPFKKK